MRSMLQADEDEDRENQQPEINLSAASLMGIFVGLVLICGIFFGLGYSVGRRPTAGPASTVASGGASSASLRGSTSHSSAPSRNAAPVVSTSSLPAADQPIPVASAHTTQSVDLPIDETPPPELPPSAASLRRKAPPAKPAPSSTGATAVVSKTALSTTTGSAPLAAGETMVQVAAVVHQEDANVLVSALRRKGYSAVVRNGTQDKLLHIQIGPYSSRAQALAMRQKLLSDGYNAILK